MPSILILFFSVFSSHIFFGGGLGEASMITSLVQIDTVARCCRRHDIIRSVSNSPVHSYIKKA